MAVNLLHLQYDIWLKKTKTNYQTLKTYQKGTISLTLVSKLSILQPQKEMDWIQFLSVQGHRGRWAGTVVLSCELYCTGYQTRHVIPTHSVVKHFKNKSQLEIATNRWRNDMLEDKPASTTMSKRQEQQKIITLCPAREAHQQASSQEESEVKRKDSLISVCDLCQSRMFSKLLPISPSDAWSLPGLQIYSSTGVVWSDWSSNPGLLAGRE